MKMCLFSLLSWQKVVSYLADNWSNFYLTLVNATETVVWSVLQPSPSLSRRFSCADRLDSLMGMLKFFRYFCIYENLQKCDEMKQF